MGFLDFLIVDLMKFSSMIFNGLRLTDRFNCVQSKTNYRALKSTKRIWIDINGLSIFSIIYRLISSNLED